MERVLNSTFSQFAPHQIVCTEGKTAFVYSEVIEIIVQRQVCWARPLLLAKLSNDARQFIPDLASTEEIIDLREGSDLLLPISFFRPALDTEIIPLISQLDSLNWSLKDRLIASQQLNSFIKTVWQESFKERSR